MRVEYVPLPPPQNVEALPVYIHNELQRISRFLGGISELHETGMYLATSGATMAVTETPTDITAYDTIRPDQEGMLADSSLGTVTFLSDSRYTLTFSTNIKRHGGGSSPANIGVFLNGVLIAGTCHTLEFSGSSYIPISFTANGTVNAGDIISVRICLDTGTTDVTFDTLDLNVTGKAIEI